MTEQMDLPQEPMSIRIKMRESLCQWTLDRKQVPMQTKRPSMWTRQSQFQASAAFR